MAVLGYLAKLKKGLRIAFGPYFLHDFSIKLILYQWTKFQYHTFFLSQDIKQNVLLSSYLDNWDDIINFKIFLGPTSKAVADRGKKRGRRKYKNLNISRTKRAF